MSGMIVTEIGYLVYQRCAAKITLRAD